jgi:hypothetical protein
MKDCKETPKPNPGMGVLIVRCAQAAELATIWAKEAGPRLAQGKVTFAFYEVILPKITWPWHPK